MEELFFGNNKVDFIDNKLSILTAHNSVIDLQLNEGIKDIIDTIKSAFNEKDSLHNVLMLRLNSLKQIVSNQPTDNNTLQDSSTGAGNLNSEKTNTTLHKNTTIGSAETASTLIAVDVSSLTSK